nr:hairy-related 3 [Misgurnus anguillicaudatus]
MLNESLFIRQHTRANSFTPQAHQAFYRKMAAKSESVVTAKVQPVKKVSKPLMEKKRRARINKCLNQLKILLETVYSNNIRKRKLEKADILELTVKHLKYLQNTGRGTSIYCDTPEYQAGYRSCLAGVSHYLIMSDTDRESQSILANLTNGLTGSRDLHFSTAESDASNVHRQSRQTNAPCHKIQLHLDTYSSKRMEICDAERISFAQVGTPRSKIKKTRHVSLKNANVDQQNVGGLKLNYWRPW